MTAIRYRHVIAFLLCAGILFNSMASPLLASYSMNAAQKVASTKADVMLICTGSTIKWVSETAYLLTGDIVEIAPPTDYQSGSDEIDCVYSFLSDMNTDAIVLLDNVLASQKFTQLSEYLFFTHLSAQYSSALSRGPPSILF
ncbi:hypothetical protein J3L16_01695 [Alteromonas sp. 5E99-2]|uniref:hypothetical protein n=1 Tax=Alteromonas sp. 5E99-2 TaxID=2817683 RepID=UPI001A98D50F|nr:hypothetical protein [Alteromonas sp. 5E99-2]MBO1254393.1 hypothetical protein [Alteromonas sp. 5E99-2]